MDISTEFLYLAALAIAITLISYSLFFKTQPKTQTKLPPLASGGWPIIGHLHLLRNQNQPPYITLGNLSDKYGPIYALRIGVHKAVVVSSWELAKEIFTTHDVIVSFRPKFTAFKILGHDYANFGFSPYGEYWQRLRKVTASELFSSRRFESLRDIRDSEVKKSLIQLYKKGLVNKSQDFTFSTRSDSSLTKPSSAQPISTPDELDYIKVEMKGFLGDMNLNVIMRMIVGKRYSSDESEVRKVKWVFREFFRLTGLFVVGDAIPFLGWFDIGGHVKEMKKAAKEMDGVVCKWLEEHRCQQNDGKTEQDFIDVLLSVLDGVVLDGYDVDTVIKSTCLTLISGATDTTTVTITWALSLLLNNRDTLKKVQDELDEKVGKERLVNESDINKLVYLQAVVKETLRLYPAGPLSGPRLFTENCVVGGYQIQAGTRLTLNLWKMHRDPRVWSEPLEFRPDRFLNTHKDVDVKGQDYELLPFGGGRRACPGMTFGVQMTSLALAAFLQAFEVITPSNEPVDMSATFGLTNIKTTPLDVLIKPRLPNHLLFINQH